MAEGILVQFYTIAKKVNSTALPSGTVTEQRCSVNRPCSIERPVIVLRNGGGVPGWNYCRIPGFAGRYYWIDDWVYRDNCWEGECKVDVLATYRSTIIHTNYYFLRSSTSFDTAVFDSLYPIKANPSKRVDTIPSGAWQLAELGLNGGYFICGIVGKDGLSNYYAFTPPMFKKFCEQVFTNIDWADISGQQITENLLKCLFNPFQYVTSCMWLPVPGLGSGVTSVSEIQFGFWSVPVTAQKLGARPVYTRNFSVPIYPHPQIGRGEYLNSSPFRQIMLEVEPWGCFSLDGGKIGKTSSLTVSEYVDCISGMGYLSVTGSGAVFATSFSQIGVNIQVSDIKNNVVESGGNILSSLGSLISGNFMGALSGIGNAVNSMIPSVLTRGANGTLLPLQFMPRTEHTFYNITDEDKYDNGRPLMKNGVMQALGTGYYLVENGTTPLLGATSSESEMVKNYLESGVYYQ